MQLQGKLTRAGRLVPRGQSADSGPAQPRQRLTKRPGQRPVVFGRRFGLSETAFSLPSPQKGGEGRGEEDLFIGFPSLRLSPRSFLARRERQSAAGFLRAEHNCSETGAPPRVIPQVAVSRNFTSARQTTLLPVIAIVSCL